VFLLKRKKNLHILQAALSNLPQGKVLALLVTVEIKKFLINLAGTKSIHDTANV
jgi:hypothetical protein